MPLRILATGVISLCGAELWVVAQTVHEVFVAVLVGLQGGSSASPAGLVRWDARLHTGVALRGRFWPRRR